MFTGLIEEIGVVRSINKGGNQHQLEIEASSILTGTEIGDSIAVNGVCLTVTQFTRSMFKVDVMPETIKATSLNSLTLGSKVNLERAMTANRRFGGHFVSGHVDGTGTVTQIRPEKNAIYYTIEVDESLMTYMIPKGSVAVDGISLTVFDVGERHFTVSIIPHTLNATNLQEKRVGDLVNIECDMLAKYIERMINLRFGDVPQNDNQRPGITLDDLKRNGFA